MFMRTTTKKEKKTDVGPIRYISGSMNILRMLCHANYQLMQVIYFTLKQF